MIETQWRIHLDKDDTIRLPGLGRITVPYSGHYVVTVYTDGAVNVIVEDWKGPEKIAEWKPETDGCDEDFMRSIST